MKNIKQNKIAFTLIEIIVAVSIFSIIMISIMSVYFTANDITYKSDINRTMQENVKNVVLNISEDIMKNGIDWVSVDASSPTCDLPDSTQKFLDWNKFCSSLKSFYLAKKVGTSWEFTRTTNSECKDFQKNHCYIVVDWEPLTNNLVSVSDLNFFITNEKVKKLTMTMTLRVAPKSGVKPSMVKNTKITTQITLSERQYK